MSGPSISVTLHDFLPDQTGEDRCAFVYTLGYGNPDRRCNVGRLGHKPARTGLVATREDDDVVSWDRPKS